MPKTHTGRKSTKCADSTTISMSMTNSSDQTIGEVSLTHSSCTESLMQAKTRLQSLISLIETHEQNIAFLKKQKNEAERLIEDIEEAMQLFLPLDNQQNQ